MVHKTLLIAIFLGLSHSLFAENVHVAVASNFKNTMLDITKVFEQSSGHKVLLSFGASGKFYAQIRHGAPFDIFLSADQTIPAKLEKEGFVVPDKIATYAIGRLALWSANSKLIKNNPEVLKMGSFNKLALANPKLAPYGVAAIDTLKSLQLHDKTKAKWVQGENIAQTYQFVRTGNAQIGFIAFSQIMDGSHVKTGSFWLVPREYHRPIKQDAALLSRGNTNAAAREFLRFLSSHSAQRIIESYGYATSSTK